jgi:hypothetical protein
MVKRFALALVALSLAPASVSAVGLHEPRREAPVLAPLARAVSPIGAEVIVGGEGGFVTIAEAITAASNGDTIRVRAGTYSEEVVIDRPITLTAFGDGPVIIDAGCVHQNAVRLSVGTASGATVRGLEIRNAIDAAVLINDPSVQSVTIDGNAIHDFDCRDQGAEYRAGVAVAYGGSGQRITGNTITRRLELPGGSYGGRSDCIWFKSSSESPSGGGHYIAYNTVQGCYDGIGGEVEDDPRGGFDRDTIIEHNLVYDCYDDGIQVEGGTADVRVRNNHIERCGIGIANAPNLTGPVYFENNTILNGVPGRHGNVLCFKLGDNGTGVAYYSDNRCLLTGDGWGQTNRGNNPIVARGNEIHVSRYVIELTGPPAVGTSFDGNCLYTSDPNRFVKWGNATYRNLAAFRSGAGQELTGSSSSSCGTSIALERT